MLTIPDPYGLTSSDALELARDRDLLPTAFGSAELRELDAGLKERAVFSARTTNARYLQVLKDRIERHLAGGYKGDLATLRVELRGELARLGYHPERGFPGDKELGIPPARPGSLQDLGSERRINLILNTQLALMTGRAQQIAGLEPLALERFPAWELVRVLDRKTPRDWPRRWVEAGGVLHDGRMVALKTAEIWSLLGDPAIFDDALGVSYPPFCWESGMGWQQVDEDELIALGISSPNPVNPPPNPVNPVPTPGDLLPPVTVSTDGLDASILGKLKTKLGKILTGAARKTWEWIFGKSKAKTEANAAPPPDLLVLLSDLATEIRATRPHS